MNQSSSLIKVVILGLGRAGWRLHFLPLLEQEGFEIVGVVDPEEERCDEAAARCLCVRYASLDEALSKSGATLYVVATPSFAHFEETRKILSAGCHCILEKPMALSVPDAEELVALAAEKGLHLFVHHSLLHRHEFNHLKEVLASGVLGPLFHIRVFWGGYRRRWDWQTLRKNGGGQINNTCTHAFSMILPLLDSEVVDLWSSFRNVKDSGDAEDHVEVVLKTASGTTVDLLITSAILQSAPRWILAGKYGSLSCDETTSRLSYYNGASAPARKVIDTAAPGRTYSTESLDWQERTHRIADQPLPPSFYQNVFDVLERGGEPFSTPGSALEVVRLVEWVHEAGTAARRENECVR